MKKGIESWCDYDRTGTWNLHIRKKRGILSIEEIRQACMEWGEDFYLLVICAMDQEIGQYYEVDDLEGDYVTLYRADDYLSWREKKNG